MKLKRVSDGKIFNGQIIVIPGISLAYKFCYYDNEDNHWYSERLNNERYDGEAKFIPVEDNSI